MQVAQKDIKAANVTFKIENAYDLNLSDNTFDTVVGSSVLRHLDARQALKEFNRVLKPGGSVFFTEPNMANPQILLQKIFLFLKDRLKIPPMKQLF